MRNHDLSSRALRAYTENRSLCPHCGRETAVFVVSCDGHAIDTHRCRVMAMWCRPGTRSPTTARKPRRANQKTPGFTRSRPTMFGMGKGHEHDHSLSPAQAHRPHRPGATETSPPDARIRQLHHPNPGARAMNNFEICAGIILKEEGG